MIDFTGINRAEAKLTKLSKIQKGIGFLDKMVKMVFFSTFILTIVILIIAYLLQWEQLLIMLVEKWFDIMVKEIIVTGAIQIVKDATNNLKEIFLVKLEKEVHNG